jgi:hypothetical protein
MHMTVRSPFGRARSIPFAMQTLERRDTRRARDGSRLATLTYVVGWLVAAAILSGVLLTVINGGPADKVSLPPVRETELDRAASQAGCKLHRARNGERLNPAVAGGIGVIPARPGFYERSPGASALLAALRNGVIVIQFRGLDSEDVALLRTVQEAVPAGTIVAPNDTGMPFAVAVTSYRRLLGCPNLSARSIDAIRLFRGRFIGTGPDV